MKTAIQVTVNYYNAETHEVIESEVIRDDRVSKPEQLIDLGYLHPEHDPAPTVYSRCQESRHQSVLCNDDELCPDCGKKSHKLGVRKSKFHAALTDHEVSIQRRKCSCGWSSPYTVEAIYGSSNSPGSFGKTGYSGG